MTGYSYNRQNFCWTRAELAWTYCRLVALELTLKEELALVGGAGNGGHDVPSLLHNFTITKLDPSPLRSQLVSLNSQLRTALTSLWCQGKKGTAVRAKANCYPYIRYLRHQLDGWGPEFSDDSDVDKLNVVVSGIYVNLKNAGVQV